MSIKMINHTISKAPKRCMILADSYHGTPSVKAVPSVSAYDSSISMHKNVACRISAKEQNDIQEAIKQLLLEL